MEHPDAQHMKLEKVEEHVPEWFEKWQKEKCDFQIHTEQEEKPLEEKVSCQEDSEPLMLDTEIKKSEKQKAIKESRQQEGKRVMKVEELFAPVSSEGKEA